MSIQESQSKHNLQSTFRNSSLPLRFLIRLELIKSKSHFNSFYFLKRFLSFYFDFFTVHLVIITFRLRKKRVLCHLSLPTTKIRIPIDINLRSWEFFKLFYLILFFSWVPPPSLIVQSTFSAYFCPRHASAYGILQNPRVHIAQVSSTHSSSQPLSSPPTEVST